MQPEITTSPPMGGQKRDQSALEARLNELDALLERAENIENRLIQLAQRFDPIPSEAAAPEVSTDRPSSYSHHLSTLVSRFDTVLSLSAAHMELIEANA